VRVLGRAGGVQRHAEEDVLPLPSAAQELGAGGGPAGGDVGHPFADRAAQPLEKSDTAPRPRGECAGACARGGWRRAPTRRGQAEERDGAGRRAPPIPPLRTGRTGRRRRREEEQVALPARPSITATRRSSGPEGRHAWTEPGDRGAVEQEGVEMGGRPAGEVEEPFACPKDGAGGADRDGGTSQSSAWPSGRRAMRTGGCRASMARAKGASAGARGGVAGGSRSPAPRRCRWATRAAASAT
jgi:hypothetical protein